MKIPIKILLIMFFTCLAFAAFDQNPAGITAPAILASIVWLTYSVCDDFSQEHQRDMNQLKNLK